MPIDPVLGWLVSFLKSRQLERPDGRWLYAYQATEPEFQQLVDALRARLLGRRPYDARRGSFAFDAAFVLYAAEWWRRNFSGSHWTWAPILEGLGLESDAWPQVDRQAAVVEGLRYWGHSPGTIGLAYLGAVAAQGGLPTKVVTNSQAPLAALLGRVLRRSARLNLAADDIAAVVRNDPHGLPDSLKQEELVQLIARMIESVLRLRSEFRLAGKVEPVRELDRLHPDWRREFPLQLDDAAAAALLDLLVGEAARAPTASVGRPLTVRRFLNDSQPSEWTVRSTVEVQPRIQVGAVQLWTGLDLARVPRVIIIDVSAGSRQVAAVASLLPGQASEQSYRAESKRPRWDGREALREHVLHVREGVNTIATVQVPRGEALDPDEPWTFAKSDDGWELVASGSTRLAEPELLVVVPTNMTVTGDVREDSQRTVRLEGLERSAFLATGEVNLRCPDGRAFRIKAAEPGAEADVAVWEGHRLWIDSRPELVFLGTPRLVLFDAEGNRHVVSTKRVLWDPRPTETAPTTGIVRASLLTNGTVQQTWHMVVLPADASIEYRPTDARGGRVTLKGWGVAGAAVAEGCVAKISTNGDGLTLELAAEGLTADDVTVHAWWTDAAAAVRFQLPFPAMGIRLIDGDGVDLPPTHSMSRQALVGARLRILDPVVASQASYVVLLSLRDSRSKVRTGRQHRPTFVRSVVEYRLLDFKDQIEELFSYTDDIDAQVEILVTHRGAISLRLLITRTDAEIALREGVVQLGNDAPSQGAIAGPRDQLVAFDLSHPDRPAVMLEPISGVAQLGVAWSAAAILGTPGLWIISSSADSALATRPTLIAVKDEEATPEQTIAEGSLVEAVCTADTKERARKIDVTIDSLARDPDHDDWEVLGSYATRLSHLPLGAFDVWRRMVRKPSIVADFLLHLWRNKVYEQGLVISRRFDLELPFLWESIALKDWREATTRVRNRLAREIGAELAAEVTAALLEKRFVVAARTVDDVRTVLEFQLRPSPSLELMGRIGSIYKDGSLAASVNERLWREPSSLYQGLLHRRLDVQWPEEEDLAKVIHAARDRYADQYPSLRELLAGPPELPEHRSSVVYLPIIMAIDSAAGTRDGVAGNVRHVMTARMLRSFDREWFEDAFIFALRACICCEIQDMRLPGPEEA